MVASRVDMDVQRQLASIRRYFRSMTSHKNEFGHEASVSITRKGMSRFDNRIFSIIAITRSGMSRC